MTFSSSMSVVEYYLLKSFPVPYGVATIAALVGQHVVTKVIAILGRASLIIFILVGTIFVSTISLGECVLAGTIFVSTISLGGIGIAHMVEKIKHKEDLGFESLCRYHA
ncbi:sulfite exporter TauE/SafE family protein 3-like isoform X2 [Corylus avellana]|uniref:sulfite exporter TauE/SafE family protein 3-like isoform X2 n=1 Tax=Corylus avellana TaxID=13451 RepID=UPI00286C963B|nr:sulfite exporter TauE/SafE family protein 3-like isoform X2 [Corylus avellana]